MNISHSIKSGHNGDKVYPIDIRVFLYEFVAWSYVLTNYSIFSDNYSVHSGV